MLTIRPSPGVPAGLCYCPGHKRNSE
jgi:hypothetical protein